MGLKVLLIDDEAESVQPLLEELQTNIQGTVCQIVDFGEASSQIIEFQPDIVVLDLMKGGSSGLVDEGSEIGLGVWETRFCPLIYYTASDENPNDHGHPLVTVVRKGSGSELIVREEVIKFRPHIKALGQVSAEINGALRKALRDSRPKVFQIDSAEQENQLLVRTIRRRVAASMDDAIAAGEPNVMSWEQYLCPPSVAEHLMTGDILRVANGENQDPSSYCIVLTPTCDLVRIGSRVPKVKDVLVARCAKVDRILTDLGIQFTPDTRPKTEEKFLGQIAKFLTQGYGHSSFPVAELPGEFPVMAADFRDLDVLPLEDLLDTTKYQRVASVDAPFRELFVWAYLSAAGRPGMPDRDFGPWASAIVAEAKKAIVTAEETVTAATESKEAHDASSSTIATAVVIKVNSVPSETECQTPSGSPLVEVENSAIATVETKTLESEANEPNKPEEQKQSESTGAKE